MIHGRFKVIIDHSRSSGKNDNIIYCNANTGGNVHQYTHSSSIILEFVNVTGGIPTSREFTSEEEHTKNLTRIPQ